MFFCQNKVLNFFSISLLFGCHEDDDDDDAK